MLHPIGWVDDLLPPTNSDIAIENLSAEHIQGQETPCVDLIKPVNVIAEQGQYYVTVYACMVGDGSLAAQSFCIWLASLKETDQVHLTILSKTMDVSLSRLIAVMSSLASTKAKIIIQLDHIVSDNLAYFYLLADEVKVGSAGAIFIPSYVVHRHQDVSATERAIHDFFKWSVEAAVEKTHLTQDEAEHLHSGSHVVVPVERF